MSTERGPDPLRPDWGFQTRAAIIIAVCATTAPVALLLQRKLIES